MRLTVQKLDCSIEPRPATKRAVRERLQQKASNVSHHNDFNFTCGNYLLDFDKAISLLAILVQPKRSCSGIKPREEMRS